MSDTAVCVLVLVVILSTILLIGSLGRNRGESGLNNDKAQAIKSLAAILDIEVSRATRYLEDGAGDWRERYAEILADDDMEATYRLWRDRRGWQEEVNEAAISTGFSPRLARTYLPPTPIYPVDSFRASKRGQRIEHAPDGVYGLLSNSPGIKALVGLYTRGEMSRQRAIDILTRTHNIHPSEAALMLPRERSYYKA